MDRAPYAVRAAINDPNYQGEDTDILTVNAVLPTVSTAAASNITATAATSGGTVSSDGGDDVTARGVCWNDTGAPDLSDACTTDGTGAGDFTSSITGLTSGVTYYVRAYATNGVGTAYGDEESFTTITAWTVNVVISPAEGGTVQSDESPPLIDCGSDCSEAYNDGAIVKLTADPADGYRFDSWGDGCLGDDSTVSFTVNDDVTCTANFVKIWTVQAAVSPNGWGYRVQRPGGGSSRRFIWTWRGLELGKAEGFNRTNRAPPRLKVL